VALEPASMNRPGYFASQFRSGGSSRFSHLLTFFLTEATLWGMLCSGLGMFNVGIDE